MQNRQQITYDLSTDLKFLIICCGIEPSDEDVEFIQRYIIVLDQKKLISLALRHGILPLIYKTIKELSQENDSIVPLEFLAELKAHYMGIAQRNMLMSSELIRIMKLLEENNIEALAFKGPTLSQMAYGDITFRQYADLDVLIKKEDIYKVDELLQEHGYERFLALTAVQEKLWIKYQHDLGLIHKAKGVHFEMHWSFLDEDYPMQVNLEDFWKRMQSVNLNGYPVPTFSNENLLVYLCIHGSKHLWERLEWIKDLDSLIRKEKIDWEQVQEKSKGNGFERMVYLGLWISTFLFYTPLPKSIHKEISTYREILAISDYVLESWEVPKSIFQKTEVMLKLFPGNRERILYLHKIILKPSVNEYWYVDLPKRMYWAYYLIRPWILLKKYLTYMKS